MQVEFSNGTFTSVVFSEPFSTCDSLLQSLVFVFLFSFIPQSTVLDLCTVLTVEKESKPRYFATGHRLPYFFHDSLCCLLSDLAEVLLGFFFAWVLYLSPPAAVRSTLHALQSGERDGVFPATALRGIF